MTNREILEDRTIVLGVCGTGASYKSINLVERLRQLGARVLVFVSEETKQYIAPLTFEWVSGEEVIVEGADSSKDKPEWGSLVSESEVTVIAPASFSFTGKLASGLGRDLLTKLVTESDNPVVLAPSMNQDLYSSDTVRTHLKRIKENGFHVVEPKVRSFDSTKAQEEPLTIDTNRVISKIREVLGEDQLLENERILVTSGPTRDLFSLPRYSGGDSETSLGYSLSKQARKMGGEVLLASGPTEQIPPTGVGVVWTRSVEELDELLTGELPEFDLILMASSAADWHPELNSNLFEAEKTKRLDLEIPEAPDLARKLGRLKDEDQILIEFRTNPETREDRTHESLLENDIDAVFSLNYPDSEGEDKDFFSGSFLFKSGDEKRVQAQTCSRLSREILRNIGKRFFR